MARVVLVAVQSGSIDLAAAREAFGEAEEAAMADGGKLWGHELLGPLLFADRATRAIAANQPDEEGKLVERDGVFVGTLPAEVGIANTAVQWAGVRWTMVAWPLPRDPVDRRQLLMHESFHRIQPLLAHGGGDPLNVHLDTEAGRTWLRLEFRALAAALRAPAAERASKIEDAFVFRFHRQTLFPDAARLESALERNEGLAEYTGLKLCGLPADALAARAAARLERDETSASFVRSFAYATGPAYGVLLDELWDVPAEVRGRWRAAMNARTDLATIDPGAFLHMEPAELAREAPRRAEHYGYAEIAAAEHARAEEHAKVDAQSRARFVDGPVLALPFGAASSYSFDPNDITPLDTLGSVYGGAVHVADAWGVLEVASGGCLFVRGAGGGTVEARVPAPKDASARPVAGDGWTLTLADGWKLASGARAGDWTVVRAR